MQFSATAPITTSVPAGYVATAIARWRATGGADLRWDTEPDGRIRADTRDESVILPVLLHRGTAGHPGSEYVLADSTFTTGEIAGALSGVPDALTAQASLVYEERSRGRAEIDVQASPPYSLTTTSTIPELRWEATATDGTEPKATGGIQLRWAELSGELAIRGGQLSLTVNLGGRGIWKPVIGVALLILRSRLQLQRVLDQGLAELARDLDRLLTQEPPTHQQGQDQLEPANADRTEQLPDLSLLNDLRFLRSPASMVRKAHSLGKTPPG